MSGHVPPENVGQALDIAKAREENNEKERQRQYGAYRLSKILRYAVIFLLIVIVTVVLFYLYENGHNEMGNALLTHIIALTAGAASGYGFAKRQ